jgi:hypothetical protein
MTPAVPVIPPHNLDAERAVPSTGDCFDTIPADGLVRRRPAVTAITIASAAKLLARHGGAVEVRILKTSKGTVSGYFDDLDALVRAVTPWDGRATVYVTANPVRADLLARAHNRLREFAREATADRDVVRRAWFLTDFDPVRPAGISSTDGELAAAIARRNDAVAFLRELDFPEPAEAMSGNGAHAIWAIDLPNDDEATRLVERALKSLKARFTDDVVTVDEAVFNAARIWKLYGTVAVKGDATVDRPHRRAVLERVPALELLDRDRLRRLAALAPASAASYSLPPAQGAALDAIDFVGAFQSRGWYLRALHRQARGHVPVEIRTFGGERCHRNVPVRAEDVRQAVGVRLPPRALRRPDDRRRAAAARPRQSREWERARERTSRRRAAARRGVMASSRAGAVGSAAGPRVRRRRIAAVRIRGLGA